MTEYDWISHELNEFNEFDSLNSFNSWLICIPPASISAMESSRLPAAWAAIAETRKYPLPVDR